MIHEPERLFFNIAPEVAPSKRWVVTVRDINGRTKGIVVCENKFGLLYALEQAIPDDDNDINVNFEVN